MYIILASLVYNNIFTIVAPSQSAMRDRSLVMVLVANSRAYKLAILNVSSCVVYVSLTRYGARAFTAAVHRLILGKSSVARNYPSSPHFVSYLWLLRERLFFSIYLLLFIYIFISVVSATHVDDDDSLFYAFWQMCVFLMRRRRRHKQ